MEVISFVSVGRLNCNSICCNDKDSHHSKSAEPASAEEVNGVDWLIGLLNPAAHAQAAFCSQRIRFLRVSSAYYARPLQLFSTTSTAAQMLSSGDWLELPRAVL